ncbi:YncE family protein [Bacillus marinisedimentorum]|uniref:YncE family protein n=1 Tax=Bacillus marinisedimentorum TaxID=1821260 RepID=UPI0008727FFF|nr:YncE family protein [Bacillus marinisedimentorum]
MKKRLLKKGAAAVVLALVLTSCSAAERTKEVSVSQPTQIDFEIDPDYSTNWWKDQPNGNSMVDPDWDGSGLMLTANEVSEGITITDLETGEPVKYIQGEGTPHHIHMNKEQTWAFATQRYGSSVLAIDMETLEAKEITFPGMGEKPGPLHLAFSHDGKYAFVALNSAGAVAKIDANKAEFIEVIEGVGERPRDLAVTPDGKKLYVSNQASPFIAVVDLDTNKVRHLERTKSDYGKGTGSGLDMSNDGKYVAVSNTLDNEVAVYDTKTDKLIEKIGDIPGPVNVSFMGESNYLATGNRSDGSTSIVDTERWTLVDTIETGGGTNIPYLGPDGLWYTSQNGAGFLTVIDPDDHFRITRKIWGVQNIHWLYWAPDGKTMFGTNWGEKKVTKVDMTKRKDFRETYLVGLNPNGIALYTDVSEEKLEEFRNNNEGVAETVEKASTLVIPEPRDEREEAFLGTCLQCHDIGRIMRNNNKGDQWSATVDRMQGNGAQMTDESKKLIVEYLKSNQHKSLEIQTQLMEELSEGKGNNKAEQPEEQTEDKEKK